MEKRKSIKNEVKKVPNTTLSVGLETREKIIERLEKINLEFPKNKISAREYVNFLMTLETPENIKKLKKSSIKGGTIFDLYQKRYFEKYKNHSTDDFKKLMFSEKAEKFKKENKNVLNIF